MRNLIEALADRGLETVEVHRGKAHQPLDLTMIVMLMVLLLTLSVWGWVEGVASGSRHVVRLEVYRRAG